VNGNIYRPAYLLVQSFFQTFGYFVGAGYVQAGVNKDVKVEKNFSADRPAPQLVPLPY